MVVVQVGAARRLGRIAAASRRSAAAARPARRCGHGRLRLLDAPRSTPEGEGAGAGEGRRGDGEDVPADGGSAPRRVEAAGNGASPAASGEGEASGDGEWHPSRFAALASFAIETSLRTLTRTNAYWLARRRRKRWWNKKSFPRVPGGKIEARDLQEIWRSEEEVVQSGKFDEYWALLTKMAPLAALFFCASFNLTLLQNTKDALVVISGGAEQLPFLAAYFVLPFSLLFFVYYNKLLARFRPSQVFYFAMAPLLAFYAAFAAVIYPASSHLHLHGARDFLTQLLPVGLHGLIGIVCNWTYSLFFCFAELWGTVVISVLFWTVANDVCSVEEAKTVYPLLGISANVALVAGGKFLKWTNASLAGEGGAVPFQASLQALVATVLVVSALMFFVKRRIDIAALAAAPEGEQREPKPARKKKAKATWGETWETIAKGPKVRCLALLVVGYAVSHRLFEVSWKAQLRHMYPTTQAYQSVLADVSIATGGVTIALMVLGRFVFQYLGWRAAALATPIAMLLTGGAFFCLSLLPASAVAAVPWAGALLPGGAASLGTVAVAAGALTQISARASKFALFDPAKEMVYIEMEEAERKKGKAAVDLLGSQLGKSGASWITQGMLLLTGSVPAAMPVLGSVCGAMIAAWVVSVNTLNKLFVEYEEQRSAAGGRRKKGKKAKKAKRAKRATREGRGAAPALASAANGASPHGANGAGAERSGAEGRAGEDLRWVGELEEAVPLAGEKQEPPAGG